MTQAQFLDSDNVQIVLNLKDLPGPSRVELALMILKTETLKPDQTEALRSLVKSWQSKAQPLKEEDTSSPISASEDSPPPSAKESNTDAARRPVVQLGGASISRQAIANLKDAGIESLNEIFKRDPWEIRRLRGICANSLYRLAVEAVEAGVIDKFEAVMWLLRSRQGRGNRNFLYRAEACVEAAERSTRLKGCSQRIS